MYRANQLDTDRAFVLVIDLQDKLLPLIQSHERIVAAAAKLIEGTHVFGLPVVATEQYPKGIGPTHATIRRLLERVDATILEKATFSACGDPSIRDTLRAVDRPQVVIAGIEAHVCVQQATLDLRAMDYDVFVCADAIGARGKLDYRCALDRMRQEGAYVTSVESVLFELCGRCDTDRFKAMLNVIKAWPPAQD